MGRLYIVGIGPGTKEHMTYKAYETINGSDVIVGYKGYVDLIKDIFKDKEMISTGMGSEEKRCRMALSLSSEGKSVALICSGDSVVYGMSGLVYELSVDYPAVEIEIIPGVTAAVSGSALIGAGIGNDFCVISLSNYLTSKEDTYKRLDLCAKADMVIVLYNPSSKTRPDCLKEACAFLEKIIEKDRVCAVAKNIGREGEEYSVMTFDELKDAETDMFSTVFIGSSMTKNINGKFVTGRGYKV